MIFAALILVSGALYGLSAFFGAGKSRGEKSLGAAAAGLLVQAAALAWFGARYGRFPTGTPYELLEVAVWFFALIQAGVAAAFKLRFTGVFSMLPACVLTLLPLGCPVFLESVGGAGAPASASVAGLHATLALASYAFVAASACFGLLYISQRRRLREKSGGLFARLCPPLETLERLGAMCVGGSVFAMLLSGGLGFYAASIIPPETASSIAAHVKFGAAAVLFCAQCALFAMCALGRAKGARLARLEIALGLLALAAIAPVEIFNLSR